MKRCGNFHPNYIIIVFSALERWDWHGASLACTKILSVKTLPFFFFSFSLFITAVTFLSRKCMHKNALKCFKKPRKLYFQK